MNRLKSTAIASVLFSFSASVLAIQPASNNIVVEKTTTPYYINTVAIGYKMVPCGQLSEPIKLGGVDSRSRTLAD